MVCALRDELQLATFLQRQVTLFLLHADQITNLLDETWVTANETVLDSDACRSRQRHANLLEDGAVTGHRLCVRFFGCRLNVVRLLVCALLAVSAIIGLAVRCLDDLYLVSARLLLAP